MNATRRGGISTSVQHESALLHVDGTAPYIDDLPAPGGLLHAHLVLSKWANARITSIDLSAALAAEGVAAAITPSDIPGVNDIGPSFPGEPLLPELAEYVGHPLVAIAAETPELARKAAALVKIEAEVLRPVLDVREALELRQTVFPPMVMQRGDVEAGLAKSPRRLKGELLVGGQEHFYLESQVALAIPREDRGMLIHSSTQHPTEIQHLCARLLGVPQSAVICEVRRMGGGFGGKESQATLAAGIASVLAAKTNRPVKLWLNRDDDMVITGKRHHFLLQWEVGFHEDGRIEAVDMILAAGAGWSADLTPGVLSRALSHADNSYFYPHVRLTGYPCKTNTQSNTAFRGFGGPQGMMGAEAIIEQIARTLGLDPLEVRRRNFYGPSPRDLTPYHQEVRHFRVPAMLDRVLESSDYAARKQAIAVFNAQNPVLKKGIAVTPVKFGISFNKIDMNQAGALVHVYEDGSILLNHGGTEMGQGLFVKVAQVVAEVFSIDLDYIRVSATTTEKVPNTSPTAASSGSDLNGMAARIAAETIKKRLTIFAAGLFGVAEDEVLFEDGQVRAGNHHVSWEELIHQAKMGRVALSSTGFYATPDIHYDPKTMRGRPFYYYAHGVSVSEVAIDTLSGEFRVLRADILHDVGASLNPAIDLGQIEGGFIQGLGWLTIEELVWDKEGRLLTHAPSTYKIPTARDVPAIFKVEMLPEAPNEEASIFRSKAVGEPPLMLAISVWAALLDAVANAAGPMANGLGAVPRLDTPVTQERILRTLETLRS